MRLLIVYDIELEDGRTDLMWTEDETNEDYYDDFVMTDQVWSEVLGLIQQEYGSKVVKYKWEFEEQDEEF